MIGNTASPSSSGLQLRPLAVAASFVAPLLAGYRQRELVLRLARREIEARSRGSILGILWSLITPLLMLAVYTFVFSVAFSGKWSGADSNVPYALFLFAGLIVYSILAESVNRAPGVILENVSYVKKIVFPLDALAWVVLLTSLFNAAVSLVAWAVFYLIAVGLPPWTIVLLPVVLLPLCLLTLGVIWLLASLGVFLRDLRQLVVVLTQILLFVSPIFYPRIGIREPFQTMIGLNPLTVFLEQSKLVLIHGRVPDWGTWCIALALSWLVCWLGWTWFQRSRKGFADVI